MPATKHCCYGVCKSDSRYTNKDYMKDVFFIRFPKPNSNLDKCKVWARNCGREGFTHKSIKKDTYICSLHFVGGKGPTNDYPDPIPATYSDEKMARFARKRKCPATRIMSEPPLKESTMSEAAAAGDVSAANCEIAFNDCQSQYTPVKVRVIKTQTDHPVMVDKTVQVRIAVSELLTAKLEIKALERKLASISNGTNLKTFNKFSVADVENDEKKCRFYTGLSWLQFLCLLRFLGPSAEKLEYYRGEKSRRKGQEEVSHEKGIVCGRPSLLSYKDQLLLTLMRLRLGLLNKDLAFRFHVSEAVVTITITTWIQFLYLQFNRLRNEMFPPRQNLQCHMPACFRRYRNIRTIIDCSEFRVQTAANFEQQGNLYSSYKSHTTFKVLIGISPNGAIMYVSDAYEGSISDKDIVIQSGFLDKLHVGDMVMADRGFVISDLLSERGVDLNIPPFLYGRKKFTPQEEAKTKQIAKVRIHVERAIERLKKYRLLQKVIPLSLTPVFSQIVFVCACLVNFQEPIVK